MNENSNSCLLRKLSGHRAVIKLLQSGNDDTMIFPKMSLRRAQ